MECTFDTVNVHTARWLEFPDEKKREEFTRRNHDNLAVDHAEALVYIAPTRVNLQLAEERWPEVEFHATREL